LKISKRKKNDGSEQWFQTRENSKTCIKTIEKIVEKNGVFGRTCKSKLF